MTDRYEIPVIEQWDKAAHDWRFRHCVPEGVSDPGEYLKGQRADYPHALLRLAEYQRISPREHVQG